jgi:hypothetical protein
MHLNALRLLTCSLTLTFSANAAVLVNQPLFWSGNGTSVGSAHSIEYTPSENYGFRASDEFMLAGPAMITGVKWYAMSYDFVTAANNPVSLDTINAYNISFFADNAGVPGAVLSSEPAVPADVTVTLLGTGTFGSTVNLYEFSYTLLTPFQASANTRYWFAPLLETGTYSPVVAGWVQGSGGNNSSYRVGLGTAPGPSLIGSDRAYSLTGQFVPEPATYAMVSGALAAIALLRRTMKG